MHYWIQFRLHFLQGPNALRSSMDVILSGFSCCACGLSESLAMLDNFSQDQLRFFGKSFRIYCTMVKFQLFIYLNFLVVSTLNGNGIYVGGDACFDVLPSIRQPHNGCLFYSPCI